jgi:predicted transcriptional regulator
VSNSTNLELLSLIRSQPSHPLQLAKLMGLQVSHVSERLKSLSKAGLLKEEWRRVEDKNLKIYSLNVEALEIVFDPLGLSVKLKKKTEATERKDTSSGEI